VAVRSRHSRPGLCASGSLPELSHPDIMSMRINADKKALKAQEKAEKKAAKELTKKKKAEVGAKAHTPS